MKFDILTVFPELVEPYFQESLLKKAQEKKLLEITTHNVRDWSEDAHHTVDDDPFGGGLGMVMKVKPFLRAVDDIRKEKNSRVILFTPRGKKFNQTKATELSKFDQLILLCGRYEGIDERVGKYIADEELSIGDYDLMGGELPAMITIETIARLIPGVIGKKEFLEERKQENGFIEYPQYTRPETIEIDGKKRTVPKVLLSGNHAEIETWRKKKGKLIQ